MSVISSGPRGGGGGHSGHAPKGQSSGPTCLLPPPQPKPCPLDTIGPLAVVDFLSGFRAPRDDSGPRGTNQDPSGT